MYAAEILRELISTLFGAENAATKGEEYLSIYCALEMIKRDMNMHEGEYANRQAWKELIWTADFQISTEEQDSKRPKEEV